MRTNTRQRRWHWTMLAGTTVLLALAAAGCSGGPALAPVEGEIHVDNTPLASGAITLWPDSTKGNTFTGQPTGTVENGKFRVMTQGRSGAPTGWYKVTIASTEKIDSSKPFSAKGGVAERFREATKTTLQLEVVSSPAPGAYKLNASSK